MLNVYKIIFSFQGGYFFEEGPGSIQSQEHDDSTPLALVSTSEQTARKINTTFFIILEIILLVSIGISSSKHIRTNS